ncbi:MAG: HAMP domain-containing sensor histidine kinase [Candidatus Paceibacterota bacterium]
MNYSNIGFSKTAESIFNKSIQFLYYLVCPRSKDEDSKRHELILNIILLGSLFLSSTALIKAIIEVIAKGVTIEGGISLAVMFVVLNTFLVLYILSRKGFFSWASHVLVGIYIVSAMYCSYMWGVELPQGLLVYLLTIVISGILIDTKFAIKVTLIDSLILILLGYFQINLIIQPDFSWKNQAWLIGDIVVFISTFILILILCCLSNREIEKSLKRARESEAELIKERDWLEIRVEQRTKELKQAHIEKTLDLCQFAEFGRIASGLFHDIVNPLTAIKLNAEYIKKKHSNDLKDEESNFDNIFKNIENIANFTDFAREQIQNQKVNIIFFPINEIITAIKTFSYKASKENVTLLFDSSGESIKIKGNPIKFYRFVSHIISNAIESYRNENKKDKKEVLIAIFKDEKNLNLTIQDWGCGIKSENIKKIFEPLFTTKDIKEGTGLGLFICKELIEKDFNGTLDVESEEGKGSKFIIKIPIKVNNG